MGVKNNNTRCLIGYNVAPGLTHVNVGGVWINRCQINNTRGLIRYNVSTGLAHVTVGGYG